MAVVLLLMLLVHIETVTGLFYYVAKQFHSNEFMFMQLSLESFKFLPLPLHAPLNWLYSFIGIKFSKEGLALSTVKIVSPSIRISMKLNE